MIRLLYYVYSYNHNHIHFHLWRSLSLTRLSLSVKVSSKRYRLIKQTSTKILSVFFSCMPSKPINLRWIRTHSEYQPITSEIQTQPSRYKRAQSNLIADKKGRHHLSKEFV